MIEKKTSYKFVEKRFSDLLVVILATAAFFIFYFDEKCSASDGTNQSQIMVSASVEAHTDLTVLHQIGELIVTEEDILRGYLIIQHGTHIEVWNNTRNEYLLVFSGLKEPFEQVHIKGLGNEVQISRQESWVPRPYKNRLDRMKLSYRFTFSDDARPGPYLWPLTISAHPLDSNL